MKTGFYVTMTARRQESLLLGPFSCADEADLWVGDAKGAAFAQNAANVTARFGVKRVRGEQLARGEMNARVGLSRGLVA